MRAGRILQFQEVVISGKNIFNITKKLCHLGTLLLVAVWGANAQQAAPGLPGSVYVMTNQTAGNSIAVFNRTPTGVLKMVGTFPTGGTGFGTGGDPLGSQGSLILSSDGHFLFAANAGSNDISVMQAGPTGVSLIAKVPSGGTEPVSITLYKDLLYVLNAGGTPNITGFGLAPDGKLGMIPGSSQHLAGGTSAAPAGISFTPDGSFLAVTEKGTNTIDTYAVFKSGRTSGPISNPSNGVTPFGFAFGRADTLIVSEAFGGAPSAGAASSYQVADSGDLITVSGSIGDTQTAPCWVAVTNNGRLAFLSNTGTGTVSSYSVGPNGNLTLLSAVAGSTGANNAPIDMALSANSQFLYVLSAAQGTVSAFRVGPSGNLTPFSGVSGLPTGSQGIAAR